MQKLPANRIQDRASTVAAVSDRLQSPISTSPAVIDRRYIEIQPQRLEQLEGGRFLERRIKGHGRFTSECFMDLADQAVRKISFD
jgi:hypothetical protein